MFLFYGKIIQVFLGLLVTWSHILKTEPASKESLRLVVIVKICVKKDGDNCIRKISGLQTLDMSSVESHVLNRNTECFPCPHTCTHGERL